MKASEPMPAYNTSYLQGLKNKLITYIDTATDAQKLEKCLEMLQADDMPCVFTDDEFDEELRLSEASGTMTHEEALAEFAKWGFVK